MDAAELWDRAAKHQELQRRAEQRGDTEAAKGHAYMVTVCTRLAEKRAQ